MKSNLFCTILLLCACVIAVSAEGPVGVNWTSPTASNLYSVHMITASNGWAVGSGGTIIRWNGTGWNIVTSPTTDSLWSVHMAGSDDGWAVGLGAIIRWNGTTWNDVTSPTEGWLTSVFMVSANDGWAVTNAGTIFRWNGTTWSDCTSPTTERLLSLFMASDSSGWAVGYNGTIIHWTGIEWIPELSTGMLMLLLTGFALVSINLAEAASKRTQTEAAREARNGF